MQNKSRPEIIENYNDFDPPANFRKLLDELLDSVPGKYLVGLKTILLTNEAALSRDQHRRKTWSRNHKVRLADSRGWYQRASNTSQAEIYLNVDNIVRSEPPWTRRIPVLRYEALGTVLFHEIGHHIHAVHKPVFKGREDVAENWSRKLFVRFVRKRYSYLMPLLYLMAFLGWLLRSLGMENKSQATT
jgi:hypothetical protein